RRVWFGVGVRTGNRGRSGESQQVGERRAAKPAAAEHLEVEPVDNVMLLTEQQRPVAIGHSSLVAVAAPCVDLPPGREGGQVDDARGVELLDLRQATGEVGLM